MGDVKENEDGKPKSSQMPHKQPSNSPQPLDVKSLLSPNSALGEGHSAIGKGHSAIGESYSSFGEGRLVTGEGQSALDEPSLPSPGRAATVGSTMAPSILSEGNHNGVTDLELPRTNPAAKRSDDMSPTPPSNEIPIPTYAKTTCYYSQPLFASAMESRQREAMPVAVHHESTDSNPERSRTTYIHTADEQRAEAAGGNPTNSPIFPKVDDDDEATPNYIPIQYYDNEQRRLERCSLPEYSTTQNVFTLTNPTKIMSTDRQEGGLAVHQSQQSTRRETEEDEEEEQQQETRNVSSLAPPTQTPTHNSVRTERDMAVVQPLQQGAAAAATFQITNLPACSWNPSTSQKVLYADEPIDTPPPSYQESLAYPGIAPAASASAAGHPPPPDYYNSVRHHSGGLEPLPVVPYTPQPAKKDHPPTTLYYTPIPRGTMDICTIHHPPQSQPCTRDNELARNRGIATCAALSADEYNTAADHQMLALLACMVFWPVGLLALYYANMANIIGSEGCQTQSQEYSRRALILSLISFMIGTGIYFVFIL